MKHFFKKLVSLLIVSLIIVSMFNCVLVSAESSVATTYYVVVGGAGTKDGTSIENGAESVTAVINKIANMGYGTKDTVTIAVSGGEGLASGSTGVNTNNLPLYYSWPWPTVSIDANLIVTSVDQNNPATLMYANGADIYGFGNTVFKNINLLDGDLGERSIYTAGYDFEFENVNFLICSRGTSKQIYSQSRTYPLDIYVGGTNKTVNGMDGTFVFEGFDNEWPSQKVSFGGSGMTSATINGNSTAVVNGGNVWRVYLQRTAFATTYKGNLNLILNGASLGALLVSEDTEYVPVVDGAIQVVANDSATLPDVSNIITFAKDNDIPYFIMDSGTETVASLEPTATAGTFKVIGGKYAYVICEKGKTVYYGNETLTVPESGEYIVNYADTVEEIISELKSADIYADLTDNGNGTITRTVTYYVKNNGAGVKDGSNLENALPSIIKAINKIDSDARTNDTVVIKVSGGEGIEAGDENVDLSSLPLFYTWPWPNKYTDLDIVITSIDPENPATIYHGSGDNLADVSVYGNTIFKDINFLDSSYASKNYYTAGYNVIFDNVNFFFSNSSGTKVYSCNTTENALDIYLGGTKNNGLLYKPADTTMPTDGVVTIQNINAEPILTFGGSGDDETSETAIINGDITAVVNNEKITKFYLQRTNFATKYNGNLNIILNDAKLNFIAVSENKDFQPIIDGAIQICADNNSSVANASAMIKYAEENKVPYYVIKTAHDDISLELTKTAGRFDVKCDYNYVYAYDPTEKLDVIYYGRDVLNVKTSGEYIVSYANSVEEIMDEVLGEWIDNGDGTLSRVSRVANYYVQYGGNGDGLSSNSPLATVDDAIIAANNAGLGAGDKVYINVIQSADWNYGVNVIGAGGDYRADPHHITTWADKGVVTEHEATIVVQGVGDDTDKIYLASNGKLGFNVDMVLGGPTVFKNIVIVRMRKWRGLYANGYNVTYGNGTSFATVNVDECDETFTAWNGSIIMDDNTVIAPGNVNKLSSGGGGTVVVQDSSTAFNIAISSIADIWSSGTATGPSSDVENYTNDVTFVLDNNNIVASVRWGNQYGGSTLFDKNLNFNIKNAKTLSYLVGNGDVTVSGGIQIISSDALEGISSIPENVVSKGGKWIIHNKSVSDLIDFTETAGVYDVKTGCAVVATDIVTKNEYTSSNGLLSLPEGEYVIDEIDKDNGMTDARDIVHLKKYLASIIESIGSYADYNRDGIINSLDLVALRIHILGNEIIVGGRLMEFEKLSGGADNEATNLKNIISQHQDTIKATGTTYYVSESGNDKHLGSMSSYPIKSISKVNQLNLSPGDVVLFKRGDTFRTAEQLNLVSGVSYGTYGEGEKPQIFGSLRDYAQEELWQSNNNTLWQTSLTASEAGNMVINNGQYVGQRKAALEDVNNNGDFYLDKENNTLYLYLKGINPGKHFDSIEIASTENLLYAGPQTENITIENLSLKYAAEFGISIFKGIGGVSIKGCEIGWIGGGYQGDTTDRYGNAIEFWCHAENCNIINNYIYQVYDAAITFQGAADNTYNNLNISNNLIEYCSMNFEFWAQETITDEETDFSEISNINFKNNILRFSGLGFGGKQRPKKSKQAFVLAWNYEYNNGQITNFNITENIFDCADSYFFNGKNALENVNITGNTYYQIDEFDCPISKGSFNKVINQDIFYEEVSLYDISPASVVWISNK